MPPITWQNIQAPNQSSANNLLLQGGRDLSGGITDFSKLLGKVGTQREEQKGTDFLRDMLNNQDVTSERDARSRLLQYGQDNNISSESMDKLYATATDRFAPTAEDISDAKVAESTLQFERDQIIQRLENEGAVAKTKARYGSSTGKGKGNNFGFENTLAGVEPSVWDYFTIGTAKEKSQARSISKLNAMKDVIGEEQAVKVFNASKNSNGTVDWDKLEEKFTNKRNATNAQKGFLNMGPVEQRVMAESLAAQYNIPVEAAKAMAQSFIDLAAQ